MGCAASRLDANGMMTPAKIRPFFLPRLTPNNRPLKGSTPSKKELLTHEKDEDGNSNYDFSIPSKVTPSSPDDSLRRRIKPEETKEKRGEDTKEEASNKEGGIATNVNNKNNMVYEAVKESSPRGKGKNEPQDSTIREEAKMVEALTDTDMEDEDDDEDDDDERMIGYGGFPGSPSFRVYFKENEEKNHHKDIGLNEPLQSRVSSDDAVLSEEPKPLKKKVKKERKRRSFKKVLPNGWNVKSCYTPSRNRSQLLNGKTAT